MCIRDSTGPGPGTGTCCGTVYSTATPDKSSSDPDHPGPQRPYQETTVDTLGQASNSTTPASWPTRQRRDHPEARSTSQSVHGFRLRRSPRDPLTRGWDLPQLDTPRDRPDFRDPPPPKSPALHI